MNNRFIDPIEIDFKEHFGIDTFTYVQKLIKQLGYSTKEAHEDLQLQMDIIWNDIKQECYEKWITITDNEDNPFNVSPSAELHGFGSPSVKSAVG